jgi:hypothetical protein
MMLNHGEVSLVVVCQTIMTQHYTKKESTPVNTNVLVFPHFGHFQSTSCDNLGIDSKKFLIFSNCPELRESKNSFSSFLL